MGLLPEGASFEELVADYFTLVRGSGLMLSALDQQLLAEWADSGAPFEVVARGIRRAAEKAAFDARNGEAPIRSLRACKREVEAELKKWRERAAGSAVLREASAPAIAPVISLAEERATRIAKALRKLAKGRPELSRGCERMLARIDEWRSALEASQQETAFVELVGSNPAPSEDAIVASLIRALPFSERAQLLKEARALSREQAAVSARARKLSRRVHRAAVLRRALDLPAFW